MTDQLLIDKQLLIDCRELVSTMERMQPSFSPLAADMRGRLDAALAQPAAQGGAVAYRFKTATGGYALVSSWDAPKVIPRTYEPLYTHPPQQQRVTVTEEIVERAIDAFELAGGDAGPASRGLAMRAAFEAVADQLAGGGK